METQTIREQDSLVPFIESDPTANPADLRQKMAVQGYLFFRHLVPADVILNVRRDVLTLCDEAGWLDRSYDLMDAVVSPDKQPTSEGKPDYMPVYR